MGVKPIRLQLSRSKGFDFQAASRAANGRDAVNVARPSKWGNPFVVGERLPVWAYGGRLGTGVIADAAHAVACFRRALRSELDEGRATWEATADAVAELRGKNLACWCKAGEPCHADVLLEIANAPICEAATHPARAQDMGDEG